ncbi:uncharacterized protein LOC124438632 [Xenia sp. Carnegie-2017]|uniref:uncharacterized protein LOC124438632 n=1 Tax=Xenia sp. Carnegie-2017 TaxID=2897299 RepID=UPI001F0466E9|nr:uncharacterized protein LOC124438632 [Xenia sp. Carnegie-2017]
MYVVHVQLNTSGLDSLRLPPYVQSYALTNETRIRNPQSIRVKNLVNGFQYRFRVAAIGLDGTAIMFGEWTPWYSTSEFCKRTYGLVSRRKILFGPLKKVNITFPCAVGQMSMSVSLKVQGRLPVVLDATLHWQYPTNISALKGDTIQVIVSQLQDDDKDRNELCSYYHEDSFSNEFPYQVKKSIHFGCTYSVKFSVKDAATNSFESTTIFRIPECLQNVSSCPVPKTTRTNNTSTVISEKISLNNKTNSSFDVEVTWNAERWIKMETIDFYRLTIEERQDHSNFRTSRVSANENINNYQVDLKDLSEGEYRLEIEAYHGINCLHDIIQQKFLQIRRPCGEGCMENATCLPANVFDGTAVCKCKDGFTGDGKTCKVRRPCGEGCMENATCLPANVFDGTAVCKCKDGFTGDGKTCKEIVFTASNKKKEDDSKLLPILLPILAIALITALILVAFAWRLKRKKEMVLEAFQNNQSGIPPSESNSHLYHYFPPRSNLGDGSLKVNQVDLNDKEVNLIYVPQEIQHAISNGLTDGYEFNAEQIKFEECLGKGAFGFVHRARALGITAEPEWTLVAVKL